jgi:F0F1-type ATP synthase assembly protein I
MDKGKLSTGANLLRLSTLGINFVLCTFAGLGLGWLFKRFLHLGDWVMMAGFFFGVLTSYFILFQDLKALGRDQRKPPLP